MNDELPILDAIGERLVSAISGHRGSGDGRRRLRPVALVGATAMVLAVAVVALLLSGSGPTPGRKVAVHGPLAAASASASASGSASDTTVQGGGATPANGQSTAAGASGGVSTTPSGRPATGPAVSTTLSTVPPGTFVTTPPQSIGFGTVATTTVTTAAPNVVGGVNLGVANNGQTIHVAVGSTISVVLATAQTSYDEPNSTNSGVVEQTGGAKSQSQATGQFKAVAAGTAQLFSSGGVTCPTTPKVFCSDIFAELAWSVTIYVA